jgi:hypothetical protein
MLAVLGINAGKMARTRFLCEKTKSILGGKKAIGKISDQPIAVEIYYLTVII